MKKVRSKKHHYLPSHYLRGFTDEDRGFFVYDKQSREIFPTAPDAFFFENNLNTVSLPDGSNSDFLEELYTEIENQSWGPFNRIRNSTLDTSVELQDKINIFLFLLFLHWRLPSNVELVEKLSEEFFRGETDLDYFKLLSKTGDAVPKEMIKKITTSSAFKKTAKIIVPFAPFFKDKSWRSSLEDWQFLYTGDGKKWFIVGDNPIITRGDNDHDPVNCLKEFIFPISGKTLLVAGQRAVSMFLPPDFILQYSVGIIERAQRFVACQNKGFLEALINYYALHVEFGKTNIIIMELFEILEGKEGKSESI